MSVKILHIDVPRYVRVHDTIKLSCTFDLEGQDLYSLTWWKGKHQFYTSSSNPDESAIFDGPGIHVDVSTYIFFLGLKTTRIKKKKLAILSIASMI